MVSLTYTVVTVDWNRGYGNKVEAFIVVHAHDKEDILMLLIPHKADAPSMVYMCKLQLQKYKWKSRENHFVEVYDERNRNVKIIKE
jgi:hypothetical protein